MDALTARQTGSGPEILLEVRGIRKAYGRRQVLRDVSFDVPRGRIVAVTGENGAGKTTLLRIIVGLLAPDAGVVRGAAPSGYCPQELAVFETLTVRENFCFFATAYGLAGGGEGERPPWIKTMDDLCARFRFAAYRNALVSTLSGGTKQKLNFCLSVLHDPRVLILDEPYAGFDWETYVRFWEFAEERKASGLSAVIVSHFVYDTSRFDTILELREGMLRCA
jgi:ABC-type multidrug transport system ATPase subunit